MVKYLPISSYIRKPFLIYDFATAPLSITLYMRKIRFSFLTVHLHSARSSHKIYHTDFNHLCWSLIWVRWPSPLPYILMILIPLRRRLSRNGSVCLFWVCDDLSVFLTRPFSSGREAEKTQFCRAPNNYFERCDSKPKHLSSVPVPSRIKTILQFCKN